MIYKEIKIDFGCRDYKAIIDQIDNAINELLAALSTKILDSGMTGYKMNTGQSNVEVTLSSEAEVTRQINKLEDLRERYEIQAMRRKTGRVIRLRDQNNFR